VPQSSLPVGIVGAGIIGTCCAAHLARRGIPVLLIDRCGPGEMTSYGNAGGIQNLATIPIGMPGMLRDLPRWLMDPLGPLHIQPGYLPRALPWLLRFARETTEQRVRLNAKALNALNRNSVADTVALARWAGVDNLIDLSGQLYLFRSRADYESDRLGRELRDATGQHYELIGNNAIRDLEPDLAPIYEVALHVPGDGFCRDPYKLTTSLAAAAVREGAEFLQAEVTGFERANGAISAIKTDRLRRVVSSVVVAAGAWSKPLVRLLGHNVPLESQRGYHVTIRHPGPTLRHTCLLQDRKLAITPMEVGLRIAGTVEFAGLDALPNSKRVEALLQLIRQVIPGVNTEQYSDWMGHRPALPDSLPVIGRSPIVPNAFLAFGHGFFGLIGAATTGEVVANLVTGQAPRIDLIPYRVDRF
jgi:D-amino-acid dehydrogenase